MASELDVALASKYPEYTQRKICPPTLYYSDISTINVLKCLAWSNIFRSTRIIKEEKKARKDKEKRTEDWTESLRIIVLVYPVPDELEETREVLQNQNQK
ncbi:hypothetical protein KQX54_007273 [Cotesia glomerata]|uniref:Uncharacterized protein n=1 Tax=Cotesia glomerata TaxID=32391 RepID=A0AAV7I4I2_COTGL|nr:hypothetical protein KQX54_007273 [Cotesia glomerata]